MKQQKIYSQNAPVLLLTIACCLIHFRNLFSVLFDGDSSLYAEIALEMFRAKDFLHLTQQGEPFLDKPHMFFWLTAISYSIWGVNSFAFKFPSFLGLLITLFSTYQFSKAYYGKTTAAYASLIAASALGMFFMTNDVRMDMLLTAFIISGIALFSNYLFRRNLLYLLFAAVCLSGAYYTKGTIGLVIPAVALMPQMLKYDTASLSLKTFVVLLLCLSLLITPLFIIAYHQFGWEGVSYFGWANITGRVLGNRFNNHPDTFYLWHTILWVLAPWTLFFLAGLWNKLRSFINKQGNVEPSEIICVSGFLLGLLVMSLASFQLSHYVYVVIPFAAVIAAANSETFWANKIFKRAQLVVNLGAIIVSAVLAFYFTPGKLPYLVFFFILFLAFIYASKKKNIVIATTTAAIILNYTLSFIFFPAILKYQPNVELGTFAKSKKLSTEDVVSLNVGSPNQFVFYSEFKPKEFYDLAALLKEKGNSTFYLFTDQRGYDDIGKSGIKFILKERLLGFHLTKLSLAFLNPKTREDVCDKVYLLEVKAR